jgi:hypothetical protein
MAWSAARSISRARSRTPADERWTVASIEAGTLCTTEPAEALRLLKAWALSSPAWKATHWLLQFSLVKDGTVYYTPSQSEHRTPNEFVEFIYLTSYARLAKGLVSDAVERAFEAALIMNPAVGDLIVGTGGVRKIRVALPGKGKRGGARFLYHYWRARGRVYVLAVYPKNVKPTISMAEKHELKRLIAGLERSET